MRLSWAIGVVVVVATIFPGQVLGEELSDLLKEIEAMKAQIRQQDAKIRQQDEVIRRLDSGYVDRIHKEELAKLMEETMADAKVQPALPSWLENLTFMADLRLRYEHVSNSSRPSGYGVQPMGFLVPPIGIPGAIPPFFNKGHRPKDINRFLYRLRFGFTKTWWDGQMEAGFRISTGSWGLQIAQWNSNTNPDELWGDSFSKKPIWLDLAYVKYRPEAVKGLTVAAGKMENPFRTRTGMTWDPDITPEGIVVDYQAPFFGDFKPYFQIGYWDLDQGGSLTSLYGGSDTTMLSYSLGFDWNNIIGEKSNLFVGATYYDYMNMDSITAGPSPFPNAVFGLGQYVGFQLDGLALRWPPLSSYADYDVFELTGKFDWEMLGLPWQFWGSWVYNCAAEYRGGVMTPPVPFGPFGPAFGDKHKGDDYAWGLGLTVGKNEEKGDWSASYSWTQIGMYAVPVIPGQGFTDNYLGGVNSQAHVISAKYNVDKFMTVGAAVIIAEPMQSAFYAPAMIAPLGIQGDQGQDSITTIRLEFNWEF